MNEEDINVTTKLNDNIPDATQTNPYANQKITSKRLEVVQNFKPKEKEKESLPRAFKLILLVVILTAGVIVFFKIIYPTYLKKTYDEEYACKHPYECHDNGNGTSTCSFYDDNDQLQSIVCNFSTEEETTTAVQSEEETTTTTQVVEETTTTTTTTVVEEITTVPTTEAVTE